MADGSPSPPSRDSMPFVMHSALPGKASSKRTAWYVRRLVPNPPSPARCSMLTISPTVTCSPDQLAPSTRGCLSFVLLYPNNKQTALQNLHIQHPEDSILNGDLSFLDAVEQRVHLSVKIDGAPAIVWGINPASGNFFVGTKSVFNKVKIKINESHQDIDANHTGEVANILHKCFDYLP